MSVLCSECSGCGWVPYFQETLEGGDEMAWKLCRECSGHASVVEQIEHWEEALSYMHQQIWLAQRLNNPALAELFAFNKEEAMARVAALRQEAVETGRAG